MEHNYHKDIERKKEGQCAAQEREECPKPETPDCRPGTTEAMDVDYQKAFDNRVEDSASILTSDDDAVSGH